MLLALYYREYTLDDDIAMPKYSFNVSIGPLHDPVTWYGINYAGTQVAQWDFQNKEKSGWTGASSFVLEVPLCNLRPSIINSVSRDRILQRAHLLNSNTVIVFGHVQFSFLLFSAVCEQRKHLELQHNLKLFCVLVGVIHHDSKYTIKHLKQLKQLLVKYLYGCLPSPDG